MSRAQTQAHTSVMITQDYLSDGYVEARSDGPVRGEAGPVDGVWSTTDVGLVRAFPSAGGQESHRGPQLREHWASIVCAEVALGLSL